MPSGNRKDSAFYLFLKKHMGGFIRQSVGHDEWENTLHDFYIKKHRRILDKQYTAKDNPYGLVLTSIRNFLIDKARVAKNRSRWGVDYMDHERKTATVSTSSGDQGEYRLFIPKELIKRKTVKDYIRARFTEIPDTENSDRLKLYEDGVMRYKPQYKFRSVYATLNTNIGLGDPAIFADRVNASYMRVERLVFKHARVEPECNSETLVKNGYIKLPKV